MRENIAKIPINIKHKGIKINFLFIEINNDVSNELSLSKKGLVIKKTY
tara:strand:- start:527 stop:670 length:144 start_codon:yes stop_codon:yes gene_type:complete